MQKLFKRFKGLTKTGTDYADDLALLTKISAQVESLP